MSRRITPESSLETLKREAKEWLDRLRANDSAAHARLARALTSPPAHPTLRDVQLALARELGFDGWTSLKARVEAAAAERQHAALATYERMAGNLLAAYRTGTPDAMERHWADTWHRRSWDGMRTYVQLDLGRRPPYEGADVEISLDDARLLVARESGFENWNALRAHAAGLPTGRLLLDRAVRVARQGRDGSWETVETTRDWGAAVAALREGRANALHGEGQMTDAMLEDIAGIGGVARLHLGGSPAVTDAGVKRLATLSGLRELDLSGSRITDEGMSVFRTLPLMERVFLGWTPITDAGVSHLDGCSGLEHVSLSGTRTGDGAIRALAGKHRLRRFDTGAFVTDDGIRYLHGFPAFKTWQGGEVRFALLSSDAEPNQLRLRGAITDRGLARLVGLDGLFALDVDDASLPLTAAGLAPLAELPHLGMLAFDAKDESMPYIAALPVLKFLIAQDTSAGDDGFVALSASKSIEFIWGRRCHNLQRRGFQALANMPALRGLSVSCKNVDDEGVAALPHFPALRELMPMDVPDEGYRHIGKCTELDRLILMYCRETGDVATSHIVNLPKLTRYFASYTKITDRTPELLSTIPSLEDVELQSCPGVTNAGIAALGRLPRLRRLHLSGMQNATADSIADVPRNVDAQFAL